MRSVVLERALARSNFSSDISDNSLDISDAMRLVRIAAEPIPVGDSKKGAIDRAARKLGWSYTRTRDVWYGTARRVEVHEMDTLRELEQHRDQVRERAERRRHLQQLAALRAKLQFDDPDFHAADIEAISYVIAAAN